MPASRLSSTLRCATLPRMHSGASARRATHCLPSRRSSSRSVRLLADRPRPRAARRRDRARAAPPAPRPEVDWLAQDPVTRVLEAEGERIHPASARLASESEHVESESAEHDLHAFHALRRMDEILATTSWCSTTSCARIATTCGSATRRGSSTTSCTRTRERSAPPFVWLTDFVGLLPMDDATSARAS